MLLLWPEITAQLGRDSPNLEKARRHKRRRHLFRQHSGRLRGIFGVISGDRLERGVHAIPILEPHRRQAPHGVLDLATKLFEPHQLIALGEREWPQQNRIDGGEHRAVCANSERQGQDYRG